ncbi:hypothetical protein BAS10_07295 [Elizabethkingia meningoseptica]|uniref:DUF7352 domain-containing protein n=1 Tax=Elizabethkingia meningoseptica TaxID=238 RepID=UPI00099A5F5D|nr:hypothetical protein [Elizabethkingia meningoseptica]OPB96846.1 hypothetical protein BAS10_07295 [Elizabethkingia meningoseptica]
MRKIFKYQLEIKDFNEIEMPMHAEVISLQVQNDIPCIWAIVNPDYPVEKRKFMTVGTGNEMPECLPEIFIGTYQLPELGLVFHCFEIPNI